MSLTDAAIRAFKPSGQKQEHADGRGLFLVVGTTGTKSWVLRYRDGRNSRRLTIGNFDPRAPDHLGLADARDKAAKTKADLKKALLVRSTLPEATPEGLTVSQAFALYMKRRWGSDARESAAKRNRARWAMFENNFEEALGDKALPMLTKQDCKKVLRDKHEAMLANGDTGRGIGNVHGMLSAFLGWCAKHDDLTGLETSPMVGVPKIDNGGERDRWLDRDECGWLLKALPLVGNGYAKPLEMLLRSGTRKSDIFDLTRSMVMLENNELGPHLLIPRTKNFEPHVVPLVPSMLTLLPDLTGMAPDQRIWTDSSESTSRVKTRIDSKMRELAGRKIEGWVIHDLRTTVGSHLDALGVDDRVIEKILGHTEPVKSKRTYRRYGFYHEKKDALQKWNDLLDGLRAK